MKHLRIYGRVNCDFCDRARELADQQGWDYTYYDVVENPEAGNFLKKMGARMVPQVFLGDRHLGGYAEFSEMHETGQLEKIMTG